VLEPPGRRGILYIAMLPSFLSVALRRTTIRSASKFSSCLIGRSKTGSTAAEVQDEGELYPDIDVGSLFCINHGRCFLLDGKLCSSFQHTGRARAALQVIVFIPSLRKRQSKIMHGFAYSPGELVTRLFLSTHFGCAGSRDRPRLWLDLFCCTQHSNGQRKDIACKYVKTHGCTKIKRSRVTSENGNRWPGAICFGRARSGPGMAIFMHRR